jgi:hypothetical protein
MHFYKSAFFAAAIMFLGACGNSNQQETVATETPATDTASQSPPAVTAPESTSPAQPSAEPADNTADLVTLTLQNLMKEDLKKDLIDSGSRVFKYSSYDLNDDGKKEIFVGLTGMFFCGSGGCTMYILDSEGNKISRFTTVEYPVIVANSKTNGWRDLIFDGGGKIRLVKYDGKTYPSNFSKHPEYKDKPGDDLPRMLVWESLPSFKF